MNEARIKVRPHAYVVSNFFISLRVRDNTDFDHTMLVVANDQKLPNLRVMGYTHA